MEEKKIALKASLTAKKVGFFLDEPFHVTDEFEAERLPNGRYAIMFDTTPGTFQCIETLISMAGGYDKFAIDASYLAARTENNAIDPCWVPPGFLVPGKEFYTHQLSSINRANRLRFGGLLAEDMEFFGMTGCFPVMPMGGSLDLSDPGTGKTLTAMGIMHLVTKKPGTMRNLVVAPPGLVEQWESEIKAFISPFYRGAVQSFYRVPEIKRKEALTEWLNSNPAFVGTLIISYRNMVAHREELAAQQWDCITFDECQALCDPKTQQSQAAQYLSSSSNIGWVHGMSGSVLRNSAADAYAIFMTCRNPLVLRLDEDEPITYAQFVEAHAESTKVKLDKGPVITVLKNIKNIQGFSNYVVANSWRVPKDSSLFPAEVVRTVEIKMSPFGEQIYSLLEMYGSCVTPGSQLGNFMTDPEIIDVWKARRKELITSDSELDLVRYLDMLSTEQKKNSEFRESQSIEEQSEEDWDGLEEEMPIVKQYDYEVNHSELLGQKEQIELEIASIEHQLLERDEKLLELNTKFNEVKAEYTAKSTEIKDKAEKELLASLKEGETASNNKIEEAKKLALNDWKQEYGGILVEKGKELTSAKTILETEVKALKEVLKEEKSKLKTISDEVERLARLVREQLRAERTSTLRNLARLCGGHESVFDANGVRDYILHIPEKIDWCVEFVKERDTPILIFALYTPEINALATRMAKEGISYAVISGKSGDKDVAKDRNRAWANRHEYADTDPSYPVQVLILQEKAGCEGHNLQHASDLIVYSTSHSGPNDYQRKARIARMKATFESVGIWYLSLVFQDGTPTVDREILLAVEGKKRLLAAVSVATTVAQIPPEILALKDVAPEAYRSILRALKLEDKEEEGNESANNT